MCGPGYQLSGNGGSCVQCEGNTVNPDYDAQCVACGAKTVANADKTTCGKRCGFPFAISGRYPFCVNVDFIKEP